MKETKKKTHTEYIKVCTPVTRCKGCRDIGGGASETLRKSVIPGTLCREEVKGANDDKRGRGQVLDAPQDNS